MLKFDFQRLLHFLCLEQSFPGSVNLVIQDEVSAASAISIFKNSNAKHLYSSHSATPDLRLMNIFGLGFEIDEICCGNYQLKNLSCWNMVLLLKFIIVTILEQFRRCGVINETYFCV